MSEQSYRDATTPDRLRRWHGLLVADAHPGTAVETVHDEIGDCLDHVTGWAVGVDKAAASAADAAAYLDRHHTTWDAGEGAEQAIRVLQRFARVRAGVEPPGPDDDCQHPPGQQCGACAEDEGARR